MIDFKLTPAIMKEYLEGVTKVYIFTDKYDFPDSVIKKIRKHDEEISVIIVYTSKEAFDRAVEEHGKIDNTRRMRTTPLFGLNVLGDIKEFINQDIISGDVTLDDGIWAIVNTTIRGNFYLDVKDVGLSFLLSKLDTAVNERVLISAMHLALDIAREGREGHPTGALLVIGDIDNVMKNSRQLIMNPFKGHPREMRNIMKKDNWETFKELSQLDGAILIDDDGIVESAGRYMGISWDLYMQGGLGGRHLGGASISKTTNAIAITVSTSHVIRVFIKGKMVFKVSVV